MPRRLAFTAVVALAAALLFALAPGRAPLSQEDVQRVLVMNFPTTQQVAGAVTVDGVIRHGSLQRLKDIQVPPVGPKETTRLVQAGTLAADGFTAIVLGLNAQTRGKTLRAGAVGALLLPEEEPVTRAFEEEGLTQFSIEIKTPLVSGASLYFASAQ